MKICVPTVSGWICINATFKLHPGFMDTLAGFRQNVKGGLLLMHNLNCILFCAFCGIKLGNHKQTIITKNQILHNIK